MHNLVIHWHSIQSFSSEFQSEFEFESDFEAE